MTKVIKRLNIVKSSKVDINKQEIDFDFLSGGIKINQRSFETKTEDAIKLSCYSSLDSYEFFKPINHDKNIVDNFGKNSPEYKEALIERKKYLTDEKIKVLKEISIAVDKFEKDIQDRMKKLGYKLDKESFGI